MTGVNRSRVLACAIVCGVIVTPAATAWLATADRGSGVILLGTDGVVFQRASNDCGLAAMEMVGRALGAGWTSSDLAREIPLSARGTSMLALRDFAFRHGVNATGWKLAFSDLSTIRLPAIAFVDGHHYVVVTSVDADGADIQDPAAGRVRWPARTLARRWRGEILTFEQRMRARP